MIPFDACKKCGGLMQRGIALENIMSGIPDFPGHHEAVTLSPTGRARLVECLKCETCGYSVTKQDKPSQDLRTTIATR